MHWPLSPRLPPLDGEGPRVGWGHALDNWEDVT